MEIPQGKTREDPRNNDKYIKTVPGQGWEGPCFQGRDISGYDYVASKRLVARGPVELSNIYDRFNLKGAINVILYLLGIVSANRKEQMTQELQNLIDECKDNSQLYNAICIASGLK